MCSVNIYEIEKKKEKLIISNKLKTIRVPYRKAFKNSEKDKLIALLKNLHELLLKCETLTKITNELGYVATIIICYEFFHDDFYKLLKKKAHDFTIRREKISRSKFVHYLFEIQALSYIKPNADMDFWYPLLDDIIHSEFYVQKIEFIKNNQNEMLASKNEWTLFFINQIGLNSRTFYFNKINHIRIRNEVKSFYKDKLSTITNYRNDQGISLVTTACNCLCNVNPRITSIHDIKIGDLKLLLRYLELNKVNEKKLSLSSIRKMYGFMSKIFDFLSVEKGVEFTMRNPFNLISFRNISSMEKNTDIMPDNILLTLIQHKSELSIAHELMFDIFNFTGMRAKEVITLKMENLHYMNKTGKCYLVYSLNKTENISKKSKFDNTNIVQLSEEIFERLLTYIVDTKDKRDELGTSLIFVSTSTQHKKNISQSNAFKVAVNRQIKKHNIRDENGKIWNFTVRQCRKKLASDMIEGEATVSDIAKQLGHADTRTASKYYAEIRSAKLASMNHVFFQKKFQNNMTEEQLASYTEEERRLLYVDFCLNSREVEYGTCTKHFKDGPCRKRKNTGIIDCASCSKICIGKKHQPKWEKLLEKTIKEKNGLLNFYTNNQITDYKNFREFQRVENAITYYSDVIKNIKEYKYE